MDIYKLLSEKFPKLTFISNEPLSKHSTIHIGGSAEIFCQVKDSSELNNLIKYTHTHNIKTTIIGWASNTLISDRGISGLVIKNYSKKIKILSSDSDPFIVNIDSGVSLPYAINFLASRGLQGLELFTGIPGTIGGAIYNNIHGIDSNFISDYVNNINILDNNCRPRKITSSEYQASYDYTRFHNTDEIIISVDFKLQKQNSNNLQEKIKSIKKSKLHHNQHSLGCTFRNLTSQQQQNLNLPTASTGYLIDKILDLSNTCIGDACISTNHANFIINKGNATAQNYLNLLRMIRSQAYDKLHITLIPEIFFKGFDPKNIKNLI